MAKLAEALDFLLELVGLGMEYADAEYRASARYKVHQLDLRDAYQALRKQHEECK